MGYGLSLNTLNAVLFYLSDGNYPGMWRDSIYVLVCQPMARLLTGANQNKACNDNRVSNRPFRNFGKWHFEERKGLGK